MAQAQKPTPAEEIARDCLAVRIRALNRAVSVLYDNALRPHGLRGGQLNLLAMIARLGTARPGMLCHLLRMEKSTLSRDVEILRRQGWVEVDGSGGGRARPLRLTTAGQTLLETVLPAWRQAQTQALSLVGANAAAAIARVVDGFWSTAAAEN